MGNYVFFGLLGIDFIVCNISLDGGLFNIIFRSKNRNIWNEILILNCLCYFEIDRISSFGCICWEMDYNK